MNSKKFQSILARAFQESNLATQSTTNQLAVPHNNNGQNTVSTTTSVAANVPEIINNTSDTNVESIAVNSTAIDRRPSTQTATKRPWSSNFLSLAVSQSMINANNDNTHPIQSNIDSLIRERNRLQEENYSVKGQLSLTQENLNRHLISRDTKIRSLQDELNRTKHEDKRIIESLRSDLTFKDASLISVNHQLQLQETEENGVNEWGEENTNNNKRRRLNVVPLPIKRPCLFADNTFRAAAASKKPLAVPTVPKESTLSTKMAVKNVSNTLNIEAMHDIVEIHPPIRHELIAKEPIHGRELVTESEPVAIDMSYLTNKFESLLQACDVNDRLYLLQLVTQQTQPIQCCSSMDVNQHCQYAPFVANIFIKMVYDEEVKDNNGLPSATMLHQLNELKSTVVAQLEILVSSVNHRSEGLNNVTIKRIISYKLFTKTDLFVNAAYHCSYRHIYAVRQTLSKLLYLQYRHPYKVSELFALHILPTFLRAINNFQIEFCCQNNSNNNNTKKKKAANYCGNCICLTTNLETDFVRFVLESIITVLSSAEEAQAKKIYKQLFKSFINLVPLFGSKLDLRITVLKLFAKMCSYNSTNRCSNLLDEHKQDVCLLYLILDSIQCKCLENDDNNRVTELLDHISDIVSSLCEGSFKWQLDCKCTEKLLSILSLLGRIITRDIEHTKWTPRASVESLKEILFVHIQLLNRHGIDSYVTMVDNADYRSLLIKCHSLVKHHLMLPEHCSRHNYKIIDTYLTMLINCENRE